MWIRGIMQDDHGIRADQMSWITFEGAHVAEAADPPWVERAGPGKELVQMLRDGEVDAIIVGNDAPNDPAFRRVFRDLDGSIERFWQKRRFVPVNHLVCVKRELVERDPGLAAELVRLFRAAGAAVPRPPERDPLPASRAALDPAIALALRYSLEQKLLPRPIAPAEVWEGLPSEID